MPFSFPSDAEGSTEQQQVRRRPRLRVADVRVRCQLCGLWTAPTVATIASKGIAWASIASKGAAWATIASKGPACDPIAYQPVLRCVHWNARLRLQLRRRRPLRRRWRQHRVLRLPVWHRLRGLRPARTAAPAAPLQDVGAALRRHWQARALHRHARSPHRRGSRACGRRWQRCALGCGGVAQLWQRIVKAGIARLRRLLEAKSVRPQPVPRLGLPHALHPAGERHELDTA